MSHSRAPPDCGVSAKASTTATAQQSLTMATGRGSSLLQTWSNCDGNGHGGRESGDVDVLHGVSCSVWRLPLCRESMEGEGV